MGLFKALSSLATMPIRVAIDVVEAPKHLFEGESLLTQTGNGIEKIKEDLSD